MQIREMWFEYVLTGLMAVLMLYGMYIGDFMISALSFSAFAASLLNIQKKRTILDLREQLSTGD